MTLSARYNHDLHTGSCAETAIDVDRDASPNESIGDTVLAVPRPHSQATSGDSKGPLWAVPSAVTAGVASQLLDGLEQPQKAFGNAHTPLWAGPQEDKDSIASDTGVGDDTGSLHVSIDATDLYAPVDVVNTRSDIVDWQLSFSEWEQQRKANVTIENGAHAQGRVDEYSRSKSSRRLRQQQRRDNSIRTDSVAKVQPAAICGSVHTPVSHPKPRHVVAYAGAGAPANWRKRQAEERKARTASGLVFLARQERERRQQEQEAAAYVP